MHEDVFFFLFLKIAIDIIYNFLFKFSKRCIIKLFTYIAFILRVIKFFFESNIVFAYVEVNFIILQKIVDFNNTTFILTEFHFLLQTIFDCFKKNITLIDNLSIHRSRQCFSKIQHRFNLNSAMSSAQMMSKIEFFQ